jgi:hypothetical protein
LKRVRLGSGVKGKSPWRLVLAELSVWYFPEMILAKNMCEITSVRVDSGFSCFVCLLGDGGAVFSDFPAGLELVGSKTLNSVLKDAFHFVIIRWYHRLISKDEESSLPWQNIGVGKYILLTIRSVFVIIKA